MIIRIHDRGLNEEISRAADEIEAMKDFSIRFAPGELQVRGRLRKWKIPLKLVIRVQVLNFVFNQDQKRITLKIKELKPSILATDLFLGKLVSARVPFLNYHAREKIIDIDLSEHQSLKKREENLGEVVVNGLTLDHGVLTLEIEGLKTEDLEEMIKEHRYIEVTGSSTSAPETRKIPVSREKS